jgi:molybdopterin-biosynthesis enzyme MoeA-like protein
MKTPHFYAIIIGSEILNGRREDKHFTFIRDALLARGHVLFSTFIIKDDATLIHTIFNLVKNDPDGVLFSFGGIGSTPDDLTRQIASDVFDDGVLVCHEKFYEDILERFGEKAFPYRINMANLPKNSHLLRNPINNMSGFYLENRYFFMPGFPEMSHAMVSEALERFYPQGERIYRKTLLAKTSEETLMGVMERLEKSVDLSSLPMINGGNPTVEISISSGDEKLCEENFSLFEIDLQEKSIEYTIIT